MTAKSSKPLCKEGRTYVEEGALHDALLRCWESETPYDGMRAANQRAEGAFRGLAVSRCLFSACVFQEVDFSGGSFTDTVFRECDFSNSFFSDAYLNRCLFENCKGLGMHLNGSVQYAVGYQACQLSFCAFSETKLVGMNFRGCRMREAVFSACQLKKTALVECDLQGCSFFHTPLSDVDLSGSRIDGIRLSDTFRELRGAVLSPWQFETVAGMLGVKLKPED